MKSSRWKILLLFSIILFPVLFWLLLTRGHNQFRKLPYYGPVEISATGDTIRHSLSDFHLVNQYGIPVSADSLRGRIHVANFFFATCKSICPQMNTQMARAAEKLKDDSDVVFVSFTVDPESDSVQALKAYGEKLHSELFHWWFLTGNKDTIYTAAREGYLVPAAKGKTAGDFFHSQDLILVDKDLHIRGIYDGLEPAEVDTMMDEIKVLRLEYAGHSTH